MNIILDKCYSENIMAAKLWIEDGSRADPLGKKGIHQILSSTILRGCGPYDNNQIAEIVESAGAILNCETYEDGLLITLKCIQSDAYKLLPLVGWMITEPTLDFNQIELEKDLTVNSIKRQRESLYQQAFDGWRNMIYNHGPYGHDPLGSIDDIKRIERKHLIPIANSLINRKKNLVISGIFPSNIESYVKSLKAFRKINERIIDNYKAKKNKTNLKLLYTQESKICTKIIKSKQVVILIGKATISYNNEADILLRLISCYLGYGMSSLLFKVLREKYGLVYETGIYHPIRENQAPFIMHASTTQEKASLTLNLLKECWDKIIQSEVSLKELATLKKKYRGQMAHSLQSISQRAEHKVHLLGIGIGLEQNNYILSRLENISSKEIREAANLYLTNPSLSICGNENIVQNLSIQWESNKFNGI